MELWSGGKALNQRPQLSEDGSLIPNKWGTTVATAFPDVEFGEGVQRNGKLRTKSPAIPNMKSGDNIKNWGFQAKGELTRKPIRPGAWCKESRAHEHDELPLASEMVRKDSPVKKGFAGTMPVFLIVHECNQKAILDPTTATKSVKSQNLIEYGEGDGREFQKGGDICILMADSCWGLTENSKIL